MTLTPAAHTPGPWSILAAFRSISGAPCHGIMAHSQDVDSEYLAVISTGVMDAHLIAAAPDLLAALKGLLATWSAASVEMATTAIAKAEGRV